MITSGLREIITRVLGTSVLHAKRELRFDLSTKSKLLEPERRYKRYSLNGKLLGHTTPADCWFDQFIQRVSCVQGLTCPYGEPVIREYSTNEHPALAAGFFFSNSRNSALRPRAQTKRVSGAAARPPGGRTT